MQPHGGAVQPANVAPQAAVPLVQGMAVGVPVADTAGSSRDAAASVAAKASAAAGSAGRGDRRSCDSAGSSDEKAWA